MKGLSIKKLAAIAVGGALVGSALAPLAAAMDITKSDVIGANGSPVVNIVAGNMAAASDFVWAGNIAARVAQLATVETSLTGGEGTATPTDLTVDLAIGGASAYSTEYAKTYSGSNYPLDSNTSSAAEFLKAPSSGQLPFLYNATKSYRYNGSSYNTTMKESIGINTDIRFVTNKQVKDLVGYMTGRGDFNYVLSLGAGIPCRDGDNKAVKFTDGSSDNVIIPFLGEEFTVQECDMISATQQIKLIKASAKATYNEGDTIPGLVGKAGYAGEEMSVKLASVTQTSGTATYQARFDLYDAEGNLVDSQTVGAGTYLNDTFLDASGDYALSTVVYVSEINVEPTTSRGVMTMVVGKNVVNLANGKQYPYDSTNTDTQTYYWGSTFTIDTNATTTNVGCETVTAIAIRNRMQKWDLTNPLWTETSSLTEAGKEAALAGGDIAHFLQGEEASLGYDFVKLLLTGFKMDQDTTNIIYGNKNIVYRDSDDTLRTIPFWIQVDDIVTSDASEVEIVISGVDFYSRCSMPSAGYVEFDIYDGNYLNGAVVDFNADGILDHIMTDYGAVNIAWASTTPVAIDLNGVEYSVRAFLDNNFGDGNAATLRADGNCQYSSEEFADPGASQWLQVGTTSNITQARSDTNAIYDNYAVYFNDSNTIRTPGDVPIYFTNSSNFVDTYRYRQYYGLQGDYMFLLLDNSTEFSNTFSSADVNFVGTDPVEQGDAAGSITAVNTHPRGTDSKYYPYYWPDDEAFGNDPTDAVFIIGIFSAQTDTTAQVGGNFRVYIDTSTDNLMQYPQNQTLENYTVDVNYVDRYVSSATAVQPGFVLKARTDTATSLFAGWTNFGAKAVLTDDLETATFTIPEAQLYLSTSILGEGAVQTIEGGEESLGVVSGQTVSIGGKNISVESINYTAGTCTIEGATYPQIVPVNQLVYSDSPSPAGNHIIVGGYLVNKLAENVVLNDGSTLQEALTAPGEKVAEVLSNGNIVVAGYTALDTKSAAQELISALDMMS